MNFDMLLLGIHTLTNAGGDAEPLRQRVEELRAKQEDLETEAATLQQDIYDAVQKLWREE